MAQSRRTIELDPDAQIFGPPGDAEDWPAFRDALACWRRETRASLRYRDDLYRRSEFSWSASNYCCGFLMLCDETFYDWRRGRYTVDAFLDRHERDFGGFDRVVLWHAYPRIGIDERNQITPAQLRRYLDSGSSSCEHMTAENALVASAACVRGTSYSSETGSN